ncbi:unnamed protein product [Darwinula stevensoni]|uniref:Peptidase M13 N-terminal domain-containing protein n=1 Tax=Darwinula stevensoni TaxID=69355 RepID=A0A7R9A1V5_9CRUS|nr:unnamed protein product [Darwinula stevensoni]CAG0888496.1 unnamed protein product [Darwinula stevensoni]
MAIAGNLKIWILWVIQAKEVLERMDIQVDPCNDFYRFACGGFIDNVILPDVYSSVNQFSKVGEVVWERIRSLLEEPIREGDIAPFRMLKNLYTSCMNRSQFDWSGANNLDENLDDSGGWPEDEGPDWSESISSWNSLIYKHRNMGFPIHSFINFSVIPENSSHVIKLLSMWKVLGFTTVVQLEIKASPTGIVSL